MRFVALWVRVYLVGLPISYFRLPIGAWMRHNATKRDIFSNMVIIC